MHSCSYKLKESNMDIICTFMSESIPFPYFMCSDILMLNVRILPGSIHYLPYSLGGISESCKHPLGCLGDHADSE